MARRIVLALPVPVQARLADLVHEGCKCYAAMPAPHPAFSCVVPNGMNGRLSFDAVDAHADAFAEYFCGVVGLKAGNRVVVQIPNCLAYPVAATRPGEKGRMVSSSPG